MLSDNLALIAAAVVFILSLVTLIILFVVRNKQRSAPSVVATTPTPENNQMNQPAQIDPLSMPTAVGDPGMQNMTQNLETSSGLPNEGMMANPLPDPNMQTASSAPTMDMPNASTPANTGMPVPEVTAQADNSNMQTMDFGLGSIPAPEVAAPVVETPVMPDMNPIGTPEPVIETPTPTIPEITPELATPAPTGTINIMNPVPAAPEIENTAVNQFGTAPAVDPVLGGGDMNAGTTPTMPSVDPISQTSGMQSVGGDVPVTPPVVETPVAPAMEVPAAPTINPTPEFVTPPVMEVPTMPDMAPVGTPEPVVQPPQQPIGTPAAPAANTQTGGDFGLPPIA